MQYNVARGTMRMIANMGMKGHLDNIGLSEADFEKVTGSLPWFGVDRNRIVNALNALMFTTLDTIGLPRHKLSAEYVAAAIALFVHPVNCCVACNFMENVSSAMSLGRGVDDAEVCNAGQLFALVQQLVADPDNSHAVILFERNTGLNLARYKQDNIDNIKKGELKK